MSSCIGSAMQLSSTVVLLERRGGAQSQQRALNSYSQITERQERPRAAAYTLSGGS